MKPKVIILLVSLLIFSNWLSTKSTPKLSNEIRENDGYDWKNSTSSFKIGYAIGFVQGVSVISDQMKFLLEVTPVYKDTLGDWKYSEKVYKVCVKPYELYNVSAGQLSDGLDEIYQDYKNLHIPVHKAIYIAYKRITGVSEEEIEEELQWLRKTPEQQIEELLKKNKK